MRISEPDARNLQDCATAVITPSAPPDQTYSIMDPEITFSMAQWQIAAPGCGDFTFTVTDQADGTPSSNLLFLTYPYNNDPL